MLVSCPTFITHITFKMQFSTLYLEIYSKPDPWMKLHLDFLFETSQSRLQNHLFANTWSNEGRFSLICHELVQVRQGHCGLTGAACASWCWDYRNYQSNLDQEERCWTQLHYWGVNNCHSTWDDPGITSNSSIGSLREIHSGESLGMGPRNLYFKKPSTLPLCTQSLRSTGITNGRMFKLKKRQKLEWKDRTKDKKSISSS